jgi:GNAT superfamily N-acetyltransferase
MPELEFFDDPRRFLEVAGSYLAGDPVLNTVVATVAERSAREDAAGVAPDLPHRWWLVTRDEAGEVSGVAMQTAPFAPYPLYLLPMPDEAAVELARRLHARGEPATGVNGAFPAARLCAGELARLTGGRVEVSQQTRLHRVDDVVDPAPAPGGLRPATAAELELCLAWFAAFARAADEQAGRDPGSHPDVSMTGDWMLRRIEQQEVWFWVDGEDEPVHVTGSNPPAFGVVRLGPVYTPPERRGRGFAGNAVADLSRRALGAGHVPCLFTDRANPVSTRLYAGLGYRPVVDMVDLVIT